MSNAVFRVAACCVSARPVATTGDAVNETLPAYSVIVALYREAEIVPQLLDAMLALDYPRDRLEILFALEVDDRETLAAFRACLRPPCVRLIVVPEGIPRTKPRALNYALEQATGELVVIYDAEDRPAPGQLREAAAAFAGGAASLACLQAPLRPVGGRTFIARQFAAEYAVQFDVLLPALHALNLPFPLGGTSNHFRADALRRIGGWDSFNVTEDADLGLRLAQLGYTSGLIRSPTLETPPAASRAWIPQRTRWIKGYMQTLLVHTRLNTHCIPRVWLGLFLGVGLSVTAALCYAPFSFMVIASLILMAAQFLGDPLRPVSGMALPFLGLFLFGATSGMMTLYWGARRAGLKLRWWDIAAAPAYWCLQSLAAGFALYQLVVKPFHWDKTDHAPCPSLPQTDEALYETGASAYGEGHDHHRHPDHAAHPGLG